MVLFLLFASFFGVGSVFLEDNPSVVRFVVLHAHDSSLYTREPNNAVKCRAGLAPAVDKHLIRHRG